MKKFFLENNEINIINLIGEYSNHKFDYFKKKLKIKYLDVKLNKNQRIIFDIIKNKKIFVDEHIIKNELKNFGKKLSISTIKKHLLFLECNNFIIRFLRYIKCDFQINFCGVYEKHFFYLIK